MRVCPTPTDEQALIWSKMTTSQPLTINTCRGGDHPITHCSLDLHMHTNEPNVLAHTKASIIDPIHPRSPYLPPNGVQP